MTDFITTLVDISGLFAAAGELAAAIIVFKTNSLQAAGACLGLLGCIEVYIEACTLTCKMICKLHCRDKNNLHAIKG